MPRTAPVFVCIALLVALPGQASAKGPVREPDDGPDPRGLTLSSSALARVKAPARLTEESIERAVQAARPTALARALAQARERARDLAARTGLNLGEIRAVTTRDPQADLGLVLPTRHCVQRRRNGTGRRGALRCRVPDFEVASLTVTFATAETSDPTPAGRAIIASGAARARVQPSNRRSSEAIREALLAARRAAAPQALAAARTDAEATARAAGMELGPLFSIAEVRRPFEDFATGSFGPGRFCGTVRRPVFRRDPATGRRRIVRRVARRRCFYPREAGIELRLTFLPR